MNPHENRYGRELARGTRSRGGRLRQNIPLVQGQPVDPDKPVDAERLLREIRQIEDVGKKSRRLTS